MIIAQLKDTIKQIENAGTLDLKHALSMVVMPREDYLNPDDPFKKYMSTALNDINKINSRLREVSKIMADGN